MIDVADVLRARLARAAALSGRSQSGLIIEATAEKVDAIRQDQHVLEITDRDMDALLAAIANPPAPNEAMLRSVARWREHGAP